VERGGFRRPRRTALRRGPDGLGDRWDIQLLLLRRACSRPEWRACWAGDRKGLSLRREQAAWWLKLVGWDWLRFRSSSPLLRQRTRILPCGGLPPPEQTPEGTEADPRFCCCPGWGRSRPCQAGGGSAGGHEPI